MQGNPIRLSANFFFLSADISIETLQARGAGMLYSSAKGKNFQPRTVYQARLSLRTETEIKSFQDK